MFHSAGGGSWQTVEDVFQTLDSVSIMRRGEAISVEPPIEASPEKEIIGTRISEPLVQSIPPILIPERRLNPQEIKGLGRGAYIRSVENRFAPQQKDAELHRELRGINEFGYSNELIEKHWAPEVTDGRFDFPRMEDSFNLFEHQQMNVLKKTSNKAEEYYEKVDMIQDEVDLKFTTKPNSGYNSIAATGKKENGFQFNKDDFPPL